MTSGPMPSPGSMRSFLLADIAGVLHDSGCVGGWHPGLCLPAVGFKPVDAGAVLQGLADIVEPVQQQMFPERINLEADFLTVRADDAVAPGVEGDAAMPPDPGIVDNLVTPRAGRADRQDA